MMIIHGCKNNVCQYCDKMCSKDDNAITFSGFHEFDHDKPFEFTLCGDCTFNYVHQRNNLVQDMK